MEDEGEAEPAFGSELQKQKAANVLEASPGSWCRSRSGDLLWYFIVSYFARSGFLGGRF